MINIYVSLLQGEGGGFKTVVGRGNKSSFTPAGRCGAGTQVLG